jgi:hypothetical protein
MYQLEEPNPLDGECIGNKSRSGPRWQGREAWIALMPHLTFHLDFERAQSPAGPAERRCKYTLFAILKHVVDCDSPGET